MAEGDEAISTAWLGEGLTARMVHAFIARSLVASTLVCCYLLVACFPDVRGGMLWADRK